MIRKSTEDELEIAAKELKKAFQNFEKAAQNFLAVTGGMNKEKHRELKEFSEQTQQIHKLLIQIGNDSGQIGRKHFGLRYSIGKGDKQK